MFIIFITTIVKFLFILSGGVFQLRPSFLWSQLEFHHCHSRSSYSFNCTNRISFNARNLKQSANWVTSRSNTVFNCYLHPHWFHLDNRLQHQIFMHPPYTEGQQHHKRANTDEQKLISLQWLRWFHLLYLYGFLGILKMYLFHYISFLFLHLCYYHFQ